MTNHPDRQPGRNRHPHFMTILPVLAGWFILFFCVPIPPLQGAGVSYQVQEKSSQCLSCHKESVNQRQLEHQHPFFKDDQCLKCHLPHGLKGELKLVRQLPELCLECHADLTGGAHPPVNKGECLSCHDVHASPHPRLLKNELQALCKTCHGEPDPALSKATTAHPPYQKGLCLGCHPAHQTGRDTAPLQDQTPSLCSTCHDTGKTGFALRHGNYPFPRGTTAECLQCHQNHYGQRRLLGVSTHSPVMKADCTSCHGTVDKPRQPDGKQCRQCHATVIKQSPASHKTRSSSLFHSARNTDNCLQCHDPHTSDHPGLLKTDSRATCFECHSALDPERQATGNQASLTVHKPFQEDCSTCHSPHSPRKKYLKRSPRELCLECHGDLKEKPGVRHMPVQSEDCTTCHDPHFSRTPSLLKKKQDQLCFGCHEQFAEGVSRAGNIHKPVQEGNCVSCHRPHGGDHQKLLSATVPTLCLTCHEKDLKEKEGKVLHTPYMLGKCLSCHEPHHSLEPHLLKENQDKVFCLECHSAIENLLKTDPVIHQPVAQRLCRNCHSPHSSDNQGLLSRPMPDLCLNCHEQIAAKIKELKVHYPVRTGKCLLCHEPHTSKVQGLLKPSYTKVCIQCHDGDRPAFKIAHLDSPAETTDCINCHDPHGSVRDHLLVDFLHPPFGEMACEKCHTVEQPLSRRGVKATGAALCYGCHGELKERFVKAVTHAPVREGLCVDCHSPHGSMQANLLKEKASTICGRCHDKFITEFSKRSVIHDPVKKNQCSRCHQAHGSDFSGLLNKKMPDLCFTCHNSAMPGFSGAIQHRPFADADCFVCHEPHASNVSKLLTAESLPELCLTCHDSSENDFKNSHRGFNVAGSDCSGCHAPHASKYDRLMLTNIHVPVRMKMCKNCHGEPADPIELVATGKKLCQKCHSKFEQELQKAHVHGALNAQGECFNCHNPHGSSLKALIKAPQQILCTGCHEKITREMKAIFPHQPAATGQCSQCHQPHASRNKNLVDKPIITLCQTCHSMEKHFKHPYGAGIVDPRDNTPLVCTSCHTPHGANFAGLLTRERNDLCRTCHQLLWKKK